MMRLALTLAALLTGAGAFAADPTRPFASPSVVQSATPPGVGSVGQVTLSLGLVLAVIFAAAWVVRRMRGFNRAAPGTLAVIADLPLGQKERAVLIRVGTQQILIGVAPGRVSTLHVLTEPVDTSHGLPPGIQPGSAQERGPAMDSGAQRADSASQRPTFRSLLMKSLGK